MSIDKEWVLWEGLSCEPAYKHADVLKSFIIQLWLHAGGKFVMVLKDYVILWIIHWYHRFIYMSWNISVPLWCYICSVGGCQSEKSPFSARYEDGKLYYEGEWYVFHMIGFKWFRILSTDQKIRTWLKVCKVKLDLRTKLPIWPYLNSVSVA